eukprot:GHVO01050974.1.p1 GENE.GHVO01050974.1~~GHVO01050974.1.p1  ORF type:complete len:258 (+),score=40.32 GHVO01050974.1:88-861(+)
MNDKTSSGCSDRPMPLASAKTSWLEDMQKGSWFNRLVRRASANPLNMGRVVSRRSVYIWLSVDYGSLYAAVGRGGGEKKREESVAEQLSSSSSSSARKWGSPWKSGRSSHRIVTLPLESVTGVDFGGRSRSSKLQKHLPVSKRHPNHLCLSIATRKLQIDLETFDEVELRRWILGLSCLIPFRPNQEFLTPEQFEETLQQMKNADLNEGPLKSTTSDSLKLEEDDTQPTGSATPRRGPTRWSFKPQWGKKALPDGGP